VNPELERFTTQLRSCLRPEDLFGQLGTAPLAEGKKLFKRFARICHEDRYIRPDDKHVAHEAFTRVSALWTEAQARIAKGIYGLSAPTTNAKIRTKRSAYSVHGVVAGGDFSNVYRATNESDGLEVLIKIAVTGRNNDMLEREARALPVLQKALLSAFPKEPRPILFPSLIETFVFNNGRRANVLSWQPGFRPLTDLLKAFPSGADPRHFVWIWNRLLTLLGIAHGQRIVHGAVLPSHILIHPETHELLLSGWTFSTPIGQAVPALSADYQTWYPAPEIAAKRVAGSGTDIFMAARSMQKLLGSRNDIPPRFKTFLAACTIPGTARRPSDALALFDDFQEVAKATYGPRRFVKLELGA
jgi:serine/threonine protein kinase